MALVGLPALTNRTLGWVCFALAAIIVLFGLAYATGWQNLMQAAVGMPPVETARLFTIAAISTLVVLALIFIGRLFRRAAVIVANRLVFLLPPRIALTGGVIVAAAIFWSVGKGVLVQRLLVAMDGIYQAIDVFVPPDMAAPTDPLKSGSAASLTDWERLGAEGRARVMAFPDAATIARVAGTPAIEPLRVYVGLNSAATAERRTDLTPAELIRIGGFDRKLLVIATPTGTGWIDPASMSPLEFLWRGDVASVSVQYSYLPSWLSLVLQPEYGHEQAHAVFRRIYGHWRARPTDKRPRL